MERYPEGDTDPLVGSGKDLPEKPGSLGECLEEIYRTYNRREMIHPDPLEFLWRYDDVGDRETAGIVSSGLAYGRVAQILASTGRVLDMLGPSPFSFIGDMSGRDLQEELRGFRHRFTTGAEMASLLSAVSFLQREWGSLGGFLAFLAGRAPFLEALDTFVATLLEKAGLDRCSLLPRPGLGSACKRLHLYLRWMVRSDDVDPGGWEGIPASALMVPVDTHMYRLGRAMGFTRRKAVDLRTVMEITGGFRRLNPADPAKYDFALTRMGIQGREGDRLFTDLMERHCPFIDRE